MHGKIDKQASARCNMWRRAMEMQRGPTLREEEMPLATVVHISSAGCRGHKEVATRAHKHICRELILDLARHQRTKGKKEFARLGSEKG